MQNAKCRVRNSTFENTLHFAFFICTKMKLRIRGNSIRLRLLRNEVAKFGSMGTIEESIDFGTSKLTYILRQSVEINNLVVEFRNNEIIVLVPTETARNWAETELISLLNEQEVSEGKKLRILIEKDFVCLDRPDDEDNKDAYPNTSHKC